MNFPRPLQDLSKFNLPQDFAKSRPSVLWFFWLIFGEILISSWIPGSFWRVLLLRLFGAKLGNGVLVKPNVKIKFPWRLSIGDHTWIGEKVWIDNLEWVVIGSNVCISQGAYLCTGNHNFKSTSFPYLLGRIDIEDEAWICAMVRIAPSVRVGMGSVIKFGSVLYDSVPPKTIVSGFPAVPIGYRE